MSHSVTHGHLRIDDSGVALACQGIGDFSFKEVPDLVDIRLILNKQLEDNFRTAKGLAASDAAVILGNLHRATGEEEWARALLAVVAGRLDESAHIMTTQGAALALNGLQGMSNEYKEVQYVVDSLSKKCFPDHPDTENDVFSNSDVALFLNGFRSMRGGLRDEDALVALLSKALKKIRVCTLSLTMQAHELAVCLESLDNLLRADTDTDPRACSQSSSEGGDEEREVSLRGVITDLKAALIARVEKV
jgi:hypothetical protein